MGHIHEAKSIAQMLHSSHCIIHTFDFGDFEFSVSALKCLAESMTRNSSLQVLKAISQAPLGGSKSA